jgi:hypothetical protein
MFQSFHFYELIVVAKRGANFPYRQMPATSDPKSKNLWLMVGVFGDNSSFCKRKKTSQSYPFVATFLIRVPPLV